MVILSTLVSKKAVRNGRSFCNKSWTKGRSARNEYNGSSCVFISMNPLAVSLMPLTVGSSIGSECRAGKYFAEEAKQTCLHLVTMVMVLCVTNPTICIANHHWK